MMVHVKVPSESTDTRSKTGQGVTVTGLPEQIKDLLWERIADGTYPPGDRLIETRIARELGVSQGPVREALRQLAGMGLVVDIQYSAKVFLNINLVLDVYCFLH